MILFVGLFLFVFGWKVTDLVDIITLVSLVLLMVWYVGRFRGIAKGQVPVVIALAVAAAYSAFVVAISGSGDPQVALRTIRALLALLAGIALVGLYVERWGADALRIIVLHIYMAVGLHALIIAAMYLNDDLRTWIYDAVGTLRFVNVNAPILLGLRVTGLTYGLASTSIVQLAGLALLPAVLSMNRTHKLWQIVGWGLAPPLVASLFLTGRTGMAMAAVALPVIIFGGRMMANERQRIGTLVAGLVAVIALASLAAITAPTLLPDKVAYNLNRASEVLDLLDDPGRSPTFVAVREMYFLPPGNMGLLFGTGSLGRGDSRYIPSDVGVILIIFAVGVTGLVLTLLPFLLGMTQVWRLKLADPRLGLAALIILASTLVFNFKELALLTRNMWSLQVLLIAASLLVGPKAIAAGNGDRRTRHTIAAGEPPDP